MLTKHDVNIVHPLIVIFRNWLLKSVFSKSLTSLNLVPVQKKGDEQLSDITLHFSMKILHIYTLLPLKLESLM